jgi:succinate dehydrogenase hydrophobic anchor subunit
VSGGRAWLVSMGAAALVLVLLGAHMATMHLNDLLGLGDVLAWTSVSERARSAAQTGAYVLLLGAAFLHGGLGAQRVFREWLAPAAAARVNRMLTIVLGALFVVGTLAAVTFHAGAGA